MRRRRSGSDGFKFSFAAALLLAGATAAASQTVDPANAVPAAVPNAPATGTPVSGAPSPATPASGAPADDADASTLKQIIATNAETPKKICGAIKPILYSDPGSASTVIDTAQSQPQLMEPLCECLSQTQTILKGKDPEGAMVVAKAVAGSSPAFQACYAVALAPTDGATPAPAPPPQVATAPGLCGPSFNALSTPSNVGFGGGPVIAASSN
jgi:hypothetical protein